MLFTSVFFLFAFLPLVFVFHLILPQRFRNHFLLLASLFFYSLGEKEMVFLILGVTFVSYISAILIDRGLKRTGLYLGIFSTIGALIYFKYTSFLLSIINLVLNNIWPGSFHQIFKIALPIGISFYIFQALSYVIDVYKQRVSINKNFINLATYISLFPQLIAGPIVRYKDISLQLKDRTVEWNGIIIGLERFIIGLAKKIILANSCAVIADTIFSSSPIFISTGVAWLGAIAYSFQIYFDFSAYSDMAIGLGNLFGFRFLENFNYPYISTSIRDFWKRWHISLSTWFRDYLYIPLGGNRLSKITTYRNLVIVFFITGLWHGASWNFIVWGLFHGVFLIVERSFNRVHFKGNVLFRRLYTLIVVVIGWVIFRTDTIGDASDFILRMFSWQNDYQVLYDLNYFINKENVCILLLCAIFSMPVYPLLHKVMSHNLNESKALSFIYYFFILSLFAISLVYVSVQTYNPFIYFRF